MFVGLSGTLLGCAGILVVEIGRFRGVGRGVITTNFWIQLTTHGSPPGAGYICGKGAFIALESTPDPIYHISSQRSFCCLWCLRASNTIVCSIANGAGLPNVLR
jgi:hypothetical protein